MKVYLAGDIKTLWREQVISQCDGLQFINPYDKEQIEITEHGVWDLHAIKQSDVIFAYMGKTNPSGISLAVEVGYAHGLGKTVILVLELNNEFQKDKHLQFLKKVSDITFADFQSGIDFLKSFEIMA